MEPEQVDYKQADLTNKRVLLRADLDVKTDEEGKVIDATRLEEALPLIRELASQAKRLVLTGHLGRPKKKERKYSFWNVAEKLQEEVRDLGVQVELTDDFAAIETSNDPKKIYFLENIRFFPEEESQNPQERSNLARRLAGLADVFINDAFASYREAASTYDVAKLLPSYLGPVFMREIQALQYCKKPQQPFVAVLGGAKLSEKIDALLALLKVADYVLVGGAMAYTLLKAKGFSIGKSLMEENKLDVAQEIISKYKNKLLLPIDHIVANTFEEHADTAVQDGANIPEQGIGIDIGPKTIQIFQDVIEKAASILWNGPMGVFEWKSAEQGTKAIGTMVANDRKAFQIAGGGDTIAAIDKFQLKGFDHVSTGGGAMLAFLAYDHFPTLDVIAAKDLQKNNVSLVSAS